MKTAGVILDFYDDMSGSVLKKNFPNPDELPESVKTAHILNAEERQVLRDEAFALVLHNQGDQLRKFACVDEGNTLLSCLYFEETAELLPEEAVKTAAANLAAFCEEFGLEPTRFVKIAAEMKHSDNAKSGMGKTRDPMHQPMVGDEADWSSRTNLVSVRGGSDAGRVIPSANQMKTAGVSRGLQQLATKPGASGAAATWAHMRNAARVEGRRAAKSMATGSPREAVKGSVLGKGLRDLSRERLPQAASSGITKTFSVDKTAGLLNVYVVRPGSVPSPGVPLESPDSKKPEHKSEHKKKAAGSYPDPETVKQLKKQYGSGWEKQLGFKSKAATGMPGMPGGTTPAPSTRPATGSPSMGKSPIGTGGMAAPSSMPKMGSADEAMAKNVGVKQKNPPQQHTKKTSDKNTFAVGQGQGDLEVNYKSTQWPKVANVVDVSGKEPVVYSKKKSASMYALDDRYPLDSYADVKKAVEYFNENWVNMDAASRHEYCVKTAARADQLGLEISELMERYGSTSYAPDVEAHLAARKANSEAEFHELFDSLKEKRSSIEPEVFAELLQEADRAAGLSWFWGGNISDPYLATFGPTEKLANSNWTWQSRVGDHVNGEQLERLARDGKGMLKKHFDHNLIAGFQKDPIAIFESLPDDTKTILARLAASEFDGLQNN